MYSNMGFSLATPCFSYLLFVLKGTWEELRWTRSGSKNTPSEAWAVFDFTYDLALRLLFLCFFSWGASIYYEMCGGVEIYVCSVAVALREISMGFKGALRMDKSCWAESLAAYT